MNAGPSVAQTGITQTGIAQTGIPSNGKVLFADQLRGLAAVLVVLSHVFNVYPSAQPMVAAVAAAPQVMDLPRLWITPLVTQSWINMGPFGVGLFFLVSGFVIPFSLRRHGRVSFLLARALRIYPTYWAALALGCLLVMASARYWGRPVPFYGRQVLANAGLVHTLRGVATIDQVNWTLVVELHFYLFAALARPWLLCRSLWPMLAAVAGAAGLMAVQRIGWIGRPSFLELEAMSLPYMLIGTAVHYHFMGALRTPALAAVATALAGVFLGLFFASPVTAGYPVDGASYILALAVFTAAYAARASLPDWRALRLLSRISYPLYAVHLLAAFTIMTWLIAGPLALSYGWASLATLGILSLLAVALHLGVEQWTIHWGAALGRPAPGPFGAQPGAARHGGPRRWPATSPPAADHSRP